MADADKDLNKKMDELLSGVYRIEENQKIQFKKYDNDIHSIKNDIQNINNDIQNIFNDLQKYHKRFDIIENKLYSLESKI